MTHVLVVADKGSTFGRLTAALGAVAGAHIVRYACGRARLDGLVAALVPDVVIGDLGATANARARLEEVRRVAPATRVIVLTSSPEILRLVDTRGDLATALPGDLDAAALGIALREALGERRRANAARSQPATDDAEGAAGAGLTSAEEMTAACPS